MRSKNVLLISLVFIILIAVGLSYLIIASPGRTNNTPSHASQSEDKGLPDESQHPTNTGRYVVYDQKLFDETTGTRLLFFHAPWCPQCRTLENDIQNNGVPSGITIFKVDYDSNQDLKQKYEVTLQTTVVKLDSQGKVVEKFVAYDNPSIEAVIKRLL